MTTHQQPKPRPTAVVFGLIALVTAILPWWRNRDFLRDFLDYGLVMASNSRIQAGESPYIDFLTPIQAGFLYLSRLFEKTLGGNYLGLTNGNLLLIVGSGIIFWSMLRTRLKDVIAIPVCWTLVVLTATQHTIYWYNAAGAIYMALATWAIAIAPTWEKKSWPWHAILVGALWLSGLNKINFHLITLCGCIGLLVRFALLKKLSLKQLGIGVAAIGVFGGVLPLLSELLLTGASWSQWRFNVLELASGGRLALLTAFFSPSTYFTPIHNHYGDLAVPQIGAILILISIGMVWWGWRDRSILDRTLLVLASVGCAAASLALLYTNHEIAYISLGAGLGLFTSLTIAFNFRYHLRQVGLVLLLPAILVGIPAWLSAWSGQRALFGHTSFDRADFVILSDQSPHFEYLSKVRIPPELAASYEGLHHKIPSPNAVGLHPIFYGKGTEWLERVWPTVKIPGHPLWMYQGVTYHAEQNERLNQALFPPARFSSLLESVAWEEHSNVTAQYLKTFAKTSMVGPLLRHYQVPLTLNDEFDVIELVNLLGINFQPHLWTQETPYLLYENQTKRRFFGTTRAPATFRFEGIVDRAQCEAILQRVHPEKKLPLSGTFTVHRLHDSNWQKIWQQELTLASGETEAAVPVMIEAQQSPLRFTVELDTKSLQEAAGGWFPPSMRAGPASSDEPPALVRSPPDVMRDFPDIQSALIGADWQPDQVLIREGHLTDDGFFLADLGQVWLRADHGLDSLDGIASLHNPPPHTSINVVVLWFKSGRIQITDQFTLDHETPSRSFHSWSSAHEGWFGVLIQETANSALVKIHIEKVQPSGG